MHKFGNPVASNSYAALYYSSHMASRILTALATLPVYAGLILWPVNLHVERFFQITATLLTWQPAVGALMAGLAAWQIWWGQARRGVAMSFGFLWFAVAFSPYTGIVVAIDALISEGWMYMPTMGLFLGVMQTASGFFEKKKNAAKPVVSVIVIIIAVSLGTATFLQNRVWQNSETLSLNILQRGGHGERISANLGVLYLERGEFDKAIEKFSYSINHPYGEDRIQLAHIHILLAAAWLHVHVAGDLILLDDVTRALPACRHIPEVIMELDKAIQSDPDIYQAHRFLAIIYRYQGNDAMAEFYEKQAQGLLQR